MEEPALPSSKLPEMRNHFLLSEHKSFSLNKIKWRRTCQRCFRGELFHSSPLLGANMKIRHQGLCVYTCESARSILPGSCRRAVVRLLGVCLLALFVVSNLRADDVTFLDASASVSISTSSSRTTATCTTEQCSAIIVAPQGATLSSTNLFPPLLIAELNGTISDELGPVATRRFVDRKKLSYLSRPTMTAESVCSAARPAPILLTVALPRMGQFSRAER